MYLQFGFLGNVGLFELFNGCFTLTQINHSLLESGGLGLEVFLLTLNLLFNLSHFIEGLLDFLVRSSCRDLSILEVSLKLVITGGQLLYLLDFLRFSSPLLLLLLGKLVKKLSIVGLGHARLGSFSAL